VQVERCLMIVYSILEKTQVSEIGRQFETSVVAFLRRDAYA